MIFIAVLTGVSLYQTGGKVEKVPEISYSEFLGRVEAGQFARVEMDGDTLVGVMQQHEKVEETPQPEVEAKPEGTLSVLEQAIARAKGSEEAKEPLEAKVKALAPNDPDLVAELRAKGVDIQVVKPAEMSPLLQILVGWAPWLLFIGIWIYFMRQMQGRAGGGGAGGPFGFGKARVQMQGEAKVKIGFDDVAGVDEAKQELQEVVEFLKDPNKFQRLGGRVPKGVLLVGSPGTGKTLLAKAVAGEAGVPFFSISGSDFVEMFVGVGAARVRDLFETGKKHAPCIIFIDEIDAVGRHRGAGLGGGNDEREQTLNAMLVEMDGFDASEGVIIIAATNRPDVLDPALLRPGRFDRQVTVPLPDIKGREQILAVHIQKIPVSGDVDVSVIARGTPGFSGADLANLVNEAALMAARFNKRLVDMADFEMAKDKVMMGAERRSTVMTEAQKKTTAYHEAGHAIASLYLAGEKDPLHKVTIIPRGRALGVTMSLPSEDKFTYSKEYLENQIAMLFGGRLAEELFLNGQQTTGASNDIERATELARRMVMQWGMSKLGPINYGEKESQVFLGRDITSKSQISEEMAAKVDDEVKLLVERNFERCKAILKKHGKELDKLAKGLLEHETLDVEQIKDLLAGKVVVRRDRVGRKQVVAKEEGTRNEERGTRRRLGLRKAKG
ncbi:MAG: ATP-dependent zinc metalloprotease FtsH [Proteobacteria bacterium]|nr:ATP-dependent zinc metalloprotease FtsH [Pseudomonadota bacterium]